MQPPAKSLVNRNRVDMLLPLLIVLPSFTVSLMLGFAIAPSFATTDQDEDDENEDTESQENDVPSELTEPAPETTEPFSSSQIRINTIISSTNLSQVYEDPQELFTLKYPYNWEAIYKRSETSGEPTLELSGTRGISNIQVRVIEDIPFAESQDFESVFGIYPRILEGMFPNITIIGYDFGVYNIDGQKAGSVIYTLPLGSLGISELEGINANAKGLQVMVPLSDRTGQALSITFTTLENLFKKYLPIAESIINSTKINSNSALQ